MDVQAGLQALEDRCGRVEAHLVFAGSLDRLSVFHAFGPEVIKNSCSNQLSMNF